MALSALFVQLVLAISREAALCENSTKGTMETENKETVF